MRPLEGRVALVTGGGRGIGQQIALRLARAGAAIVINDLDAAPAAQTVAMVEDLGGRALAVAGSVAEVGFAERFIDAAVSTYGGVHVVVNNAGFTWDSVIQKMTDEQWQTILDVHLSSPFRLLRALQPVFSAAVKTERAAGTVIHRKVVNVSSIAGIGGNVGQSNYSAAKAGVEGLTRTLSKEWGRLGVNVNAVAFGLISTRLTQAVDSGATVDVEGREIRVGMNPQLLQTMESMIPLGRAGTAEEAAGAVYLLCSPDSDYVSGQTLVCSGGYMF